MTATRHSHPPLDEPTTGSVDDSRAHIWFLILVVALVAVAPLLLWWGRNQWFALDEWAFFVNRRLSDVPSMLQNHGGHWVTIPAIVYQVLFRVFGLRSYLPYQVVVVLVHLVVLVLVWLTMRRLMVRPAIATLTVLPFVVFGAGSQDILFGFTINLTGSLVFGLAHLLLATDDAPTRRKDVVGIGFGLAAIMSSAVGVPMVVGVALGVLIRRGWRAAALHAVPLAVVYAAWYVAYGQGAKKVSFRLRLGDDLIWRPHGPSSVCRAGAKSLRRSRARPGRCGRYRAGGAGRILRSSRRDPGHRDGAHRQLVHVHDGDSHRSRRRRWGAGGIVSAATSTSLLRSCCRSLRSAGSCWPDTGSCSVPFPSSCSLSGFLTTSTCSAVSINRR